MAQNVLTGVVLAIFGAAVIWPGAAVVGELGDGGRGAFAVDAALLGRSVFVAGVIALLASVLGLPAAWVMRRGGAVIIMLAPLLLPSYLAYTGWGVLRAPDTALGRWLMMGGGRQPDSTNWYPVIAGYVLAIGGLALWAWPLGALVVGVRFRRIDEATLDALRLDVRSSWRRGVEVLWMCRGSIAAAFGLVFLVMLGSAVPLHLAQLETYAIRLWRMLDQTARDEQWRVWAASWPLLLVAIGAAALIVRKIAGADIEEAPPSPRIGARLRLAAAAVWCLSILAPVVLLVGSVRSWDAWEGFWRLIRGPLLNSLGVSALVAIVTVLLVGWAWMAFAGRRGGRIAGAVVAGVMVACGLAPGVLIGAAMVRGWGGTEVGDLPVIVVLAHVARFGMIGVLAGWWLAATEGRWLRDMRRMDSGGSVRGWVETAWQPQAGAIAAATVGAGLLSFHEIEATVLVQPASTSGGSFAWQILQWLHFARMDELAMGVMIVVGLGLAAMGLIAAGLARRRA